jgi:glycerate kinase
MRVLIVPDKFKGTLRADEAARAIAEGWRKLRPHDQLELLPMSDGGDGFGEILGDLLQAERLTFSTVNAAHQPIQARWWWSEKARTAIVESAAVIGLAMLPPGKFHPFDLDTLGLGILLREIAASKPDSRLIIGIGGSATNDAGFGLARGLGFEFTDSKGNPIERWTDLDRLAHLRPPGDCPRFSTVVIASDVQNPLLGPSGATRIYGPQKGMRPEDFSVADRAFERLDQIVQRTLEISCANEQGAGAAGGLGYGLRVFLQGRFEPGFEVFSQAARLTQRIDAADIVITGEGSIDEQSEMGKGTGAVAKLARAAGKRCIGLAAITPGAKPSTRTFDLLLRIVPELAPAEAARAQPAAYLRELAARAAALVQEGALCVS